LLTLNNQEAEINVSQVVPVSTKTTTNNQLQTTTEFEFKDVGIILSITPQITGQNKVRLLIKQESSSIAAKQALTSSNQTAITTLKRKINTQVVVDDNTTMAIGGLIHDQSVETETKVPCLGDIPLIGWLFKSKTEKIEKINLIVFIRPRIISTREHLEEATRRVQQRFDDVTTPKAKTGDLLRDSFGLPPRPEPPKDEDEKDKRKVEDVDAP
jgi:general secretion pathway protein D